MRKTKIICTMGPSNRDTEVLKNLMLNGMNVARLNFSHDTREAHGKVIDQIKELREELDLPIGILLDTRGPEIRLGNFEHGKVHLKKGQHFTLTTAEILGNEERASISYKDLPKDMEVGSHVLIDDGRIEMILESIVDCELRCLVLTDGEISDHKGINVPDAKLSMPYMSEEDRKDLIFGAQKGVDFIAASFVRGPEDIDEMEEILKAHGGDEIKIIAKIENRQGLDHLDEILEKASGIMIARGDLGVEIPLKEIPTIQKEIIKKAYDAGKIAITATQMLESMIHAKRPTRAEANDVATAVYDGTSAIMLSGETAAGEYPVEALQTMAEIAEYTENHIDYESCFLQAAKRDEVSVTAAISHATCMTAIDIAAAGIITVTESGRTARTIAGYRPKCPILGCTPLEKTYQQMSLSWGVIPLQIPEKQTTEELFCEACEKAEEAGIINKEDTVVITAGVPLGHSGTTNLIRVVSPGSSCR